MVTVQKRIISAAAAAAVATGCIAVPVPAAAANVQNDVVEYCQDYINEIYNLYHGGVMPEDAVQNEYAAAYAVSMYISKAMRAAYEPDFHNEVNALLTGFYYDTDHNIHVTTFFTGLAVKQIKRRFLIAASDEHYCLLEGLYPIGENNVSGYGCKDEGDDAKRVYSFSLGTYYGNSGSYERIGFNIINDDGDTATRFGRDETVEVNISRPATVCTVFPPTNLSSWCGYLPIPQSDGTSVKINPGYIPVNSSDFSASDENFRSIVNNYIVQNYPDSTFQVPETIPDAPIETLPNDEYSGLPAGWNEINPVPLPDIETPSLPVDGSEDFAESIDGLQFLSAFRDGLGFWARSVSWVCEHFPLATRVLLALGLLGLLAFIFWRWSL